MSSIKSSYISSKGLGSEVPAWEDPLSSVGIRESESACRAGLREETKAIAPRPVLWRVVLPV